MENATKALLIAGGILITMLIIAVGIYLKGNIGKIGDSYVNKLETTELQKYNSNFIVFIDESADKRSVTAQDIITLVNYAQQTNKGTMVYIGETELTCNFDEEDKNQFLTDNIKSKYNYQAIEYNTEGRVIKIKFKKII